MFPVIIVANIPNLRLEDDLLKRLRAREDGAAADLVAAYRGRVYQLALRYVRSPEDAEEVTQDVLFKAVERIDDFRGDAALSSWLYRITFNTAMTRLRQMRSARSTRSSAMSLRSAGSARTGAGDSPSTGARRSSSCDR